MSTSANNSVRVPSSSLVQSLSPSSKKKSSNKEGDSLSDRIALAEASNPRSYGSQYSALTALAMYNKNQTPLQPQQQAAAWPSANSPSSSSNVRSKSKKEEDGEGGGGSRPFGGSNPDGGCPNCRGPHALDDGKSPWKAEEKTSEKQEPPKSETKPESNVTTRATVEIKKDD